MNSKIIIVATIAALSLATTAFAGEGDRGRDAGVPMQSSYAAGQMADAGYQQTGSGRLDNTTLPENGQNGPVESPNSLPRGAMNGTLAYMYAQSVNTYYAQQADHRFTQARTLQPNG